MARGNQKGQAASIKADAVATPKEPKKVTEGEAIMKLSYDFAQGDGIEESAKQMIDDLENNPTKGVATMEAVKEFGYALAEYQSNAHNETGGYKARRERLIDALKALPEQMRNALSVPGEAALFAQDHIIRGGDHASRPGRNGEIVASFTMDKSTAKSFPLGQNAKGDGYFYTLRDVENYDGIFSVGKAALLRSKIGDLIKTANATGDNLPSLATFWSDTPRVGESEFVVYGIKWDKSVDTPAWKAKHSNAYKKNLGTSQQIKALGG